jgi:UDP-glucuronate decarboxylase
MNALVTGGSGFIGINLVMRLLKEEYKTTVIDNNINIFNENKKSRTPAFQLGAEDSKCEKIFADTCFDVVFHLAFHMPSGEMDDHEIHQKHLNQAGLSNILYLSKKYHVPKVIVVSSYHVYGRQKRLPIREEAMLHPFDPIGYHQLTREQLCNEYRQGGMNVIILRTGHIYGPSGEKEPGNYIHLRISDILANRYTASQEMDLSQSDYIYINDIIEALVLTAEKEVPPILNISSGLGVTKHDIDRICQKIQDEQSADQSKKGNPPDKPENPPVERLTPQSVMTISSELPDEPHCILDNQLATLALNWQPKFTLEEGIKKTIEWSVKSQKESVLNQKTAVNTSEKKKRLSLDIRHVAETLALGSLAALLAYLVEYRLGIKTDILLLYVTTASLLFGIKQGSLAIILAIAARIVLLLFFREQQAIVLIHDVNAIMQMTLYLIFGACIGYTIDAKFRQNENIKNDLYKAKRELAFVNILYQKSLEVKNSLQFTIENSSNSLGKLIHLISRLERAKQDAIFDEVAGIYADLLHAKHVHVFCTDSTGQWLRLASTVGGIKYSKSIQSKQFDFLETVFKDHCLFINRELNPEYPLICTPLCIGDQTDAIIFIDGIEFIKLTQQFVNTLKALTVLVSESIENKYKYEAAAQSEKFFYNTFIMKKNWFEKSIQEKFESNQHNIIVLKINNEIHNYRNFNRIINNLIRSADSVGELSQGRLGIVLIDADPQYLPIIQARFSEKGLSVEPINLGVK